MTRPRKKSRKGKDILQVGNPQIINGQQTTRTLAAHPADARKSSVLVKVIHVPRHEEGQNGFESIVSRIVTGTNWQSTIIASDLVSNDRTQIELERSFRKLGYYYIRKRQSKGEAKRFSPGKHYRLFTKVELAKAVAACEFDPATVRHGTEELFEESLYPKVFPNTDPDFYLSRYRLWCEVAYAARGDRECKYVKWHVLNFVWPHLAAMVRSARNARAFRILTERFDGDLPHWLNKAIAKVFKEVLKYYRQNRGKGKAAADVTVFSKQKGHHRKFEEFWQAKSKEKRTFANFMAKVQAVIEGFDE